LNVGHPGISLLPEIELSKIKRQIAVVQPDVLIIDSVQIVYKGELASTPGSVSQVKEVAMESMRLAKTKGITTLLVGHVTKSGEIAGPRVLEHIVDAVFEFEGDRQHGYRIIRSIKNRFGPTDDVAVFQMKERGLEEVSNPSEAFLQERVQHSSGSVIVPTVEGTRSILVEVQALVTNSSYATSSRRSTGVDPKRLTLLLAVLEKQMGYHLHSVDIFVSVAGGLNISEPAIDYGVVMAVASSYCNQVIDPFTLVVGEVGLSGEMRSVPRIESRLKEAIHMGFKRCILPRRNLKSLPKDLQNQIELVGIDKMGEGIKLLLKPLPTRVSS